MKASMRMQGKEWLVSLLYPRRCPVCHEIVVPKGGLICPDCLRQVTFVQEPVCLCCGKPVASAEMEYCYDCSRQPRFFERGFALAVYDDVMRRSIRSFKNKGRVEYADWYAAALWERYGDDFKKLKADALVPVPLHAARKNRRGYNQAQVLAERLADYLELPVLPRALLRPHKTVAQKYLSAGERGRNLETAFAPGPQAASLAGRTVILTDDIYTTGQTARSCARVLLEAGVSKVYVVCVCIGENDE